MKHMHTPGDSPAKKKINAGKNSFEMLVDEAADGTDQNVDASSAAGSPGAVGRSPSNSSGRNANSPHLAPSSYADAAGSGGGPSPPDWFIAYESRQRAEFKAFEDRQQARLDTILGLCKQEHEGIYHEINCLKDEVAKLNKKLVDSESKIDDLENRGRRNNIVMYNIPEGKENNNCIKLVEDLLVQAGIQGASQIQRAHRTGQLPKVSSSGSASNVKRPRPIHVGFSSFREKEAARKALIAYFKSKQDGDPSKYAVSDDYSLRVQKLRKEKIPELKRLRLEGKKAFLAYPAEIRILKN